jgi:uncharacterized protein with ParB-like and HNH nuclease domain
MDYKLKEFTVKGLVKLIDLEKVNLNPEYQRNFIWSLGDQNDLIDTIIKGYPLPNFFMFEDENGNLEMVDGQQRSKTIYRFIKGLITSSKTTGKLAFSNCNPELIEYKLPFIVLSNLDESDSLKDFYVLINKKGKNLNIPEVNKSEYFETNFLKLANNVLDYQNLINLNLFTLASRKRMNDRAYVEEILAYLKMGVKDKKSSVEHLFQNDISDNEFEEIQTNFYRVIDKFEILNNSYRIDKTRYKQKNDFYTLFNFVNENLDANDDLLLHQYKILVILDGVDEKGRQLIRPSNGECNTLKEYANNCVTQSNSKKAREDRLKFFNSILKNQDVENNFALKDVLDYLEEIYKIEEIELISFEDYELIDLTKFNNI